MDELDLEHEGEVHRRVARGLRRVDGVTVAKVDGELTTPHVHVSAFLAGPTLADGPPADPGAAARMLIKVFAGAPAAIGTVLANPRPNDIVFLDDGTIGLIGPGAARAVDPFRHGEIVAAAVALADGDRKAFVAAVSKIDLLPDKHAGEAYDLIEELLGDLLMNGPALLDDAALAAAGEAALERIDELVALGSKGTPDPADVWPARLLGQLSSTLAKLGATEDWLALTAQALRDGWAMIALVAGATRGAGRGIAVALGEIGATVYCSGRTTRERRSEYDRPETIEETAELVTAAGGTGIAVPTDHLDHGAGRGARRADRRRAGPARRPRQRHLGRRAAVRVEGAGVGARPRQRPAHAAAGDRHAPDHDPLRAAAAHPQPRRPGRRDDGRHARVQRRELPPDDVLRPRQERGHPDGVRAVEGAGAARLHRRRPDAGLAAQRDDARELPASPRTTGARRRRSSRTSRRSPSRRGTSAARSRRSRPTPTWRAATAARSPPASWRRSTASPTSTARSRTAGATWSRSRIPACRRTRPATAERAYMGRCSVMHRGDA